MRGTIAAVAAAAALAGCGGNADTTATQTVTATPTTSATPTAARPGLVPGGWGDVRPDNQAIDAMAQWVAVSRDGVYTNMTETKRAMDKVRAAVDDGDVSAVTSACQQISEQLIIQLPAHIPTPDPDLTHALQSLVAEAKTFATKCNALTDPAPSSDLQSLSKVSLWTLWHGLRATGAILNRDEQILEAAGLLAPRRSS